MSAWRAELLKIATVRGQWVSAVLATAVIPLTSLLVVATGGLASGSSVVTGAATGALAGILAFGAWSATITAGEYARATMLVTLATVPRRLVFFGAKLMAVATVCGLGAIVSMAASLAIVLAVVPKGHRLGDPGSLGGVVLAVVVVSVIGAGVGIMTKSPSAANAIVFAFVLLPNAAAGLLGGLQRWVVGASPGTVVTQIVGGSRLPSSQLFPGGAGAAATALLVLAMVVATGGALVFVRRDG